MVNLLELERKYLGFRDHLDNLNISSFKFTYMRSIDQLCYFIFIILSEEERKAKFLSAKDFGKLYILLSFFILIIE